MTTLSDLKALVEAATPGPWEYTNGLMRLLGEPEHAPFVIVSEDGDKVLNDETADSDDMRLIAALRNAAPALIAVAEAAKALPWPKSHPGCTCHFYDFECSDCRERFKALSKTLAQLEATP